jgi:hypothetical protein
MSYAEVASARNSQAQAVYLPTAAPTPLHHAAYLQGFAVLTQLLRVCFVTAKPCQAALDKLQAGVPWSAADGALVYGWAPSDCPSQVRVTGCTQALSIDWLVTHIAWYGWVVQSTCCVDRLGDVLDGVVHFTMQISPDAVLPSFIDL